MNDFCKPGADNGTFHGTPKKVLILDSNTLITDHLDSFLSLYGYTVVYAPDVANEFTLVEGE